MGFGVPHQGETAIGASPLNGAPGPLAPPPRWAPTASCGVSLGGSGARNNKCGVFLPRERVSGLAWSSVASVLGRITTSDSAPRGPDVKHRLRVKRRWLERGETIEIDLPRNLLCAKCDGGGCDTCSGSGALTLRERDAAVEVLQITLPPDQGADPRRAVALRIPERGGFSEQAGVPRGMLIMTIMAADETDQGVRRVHPSLVPPPVAADLEMLTPPADAKEEAGISWPLVLVAAIVVWLLVLGALAAFGVY